MKMPSSSFFVTAIAATALFANAASAALVIDVGNHALQPNMPNQTIQISVSGGDNVDGFNFFVATGDGGSALGGTDDGPKITSVSLNGSGLLFAGGTQTTTDPYPQFWAGYVDIDVALSATGAVAELVIDTTGLDAGTFSLAIGSPELPSPFETSFSFAGNDIYPAITNGSITIVAVPEPVSIGLMMAALALPLARRRRR